MLLSVLWIGIIAAMAISDPWRVVERSRPLTAAEVKDCDERYPSQRWCTESRIVEKPSTVERAYEFRWYFAAALGVPVAGLAFGVAVGWVLSGFKSRRSQ